MARSLACAPARDLVAKIRKPAWQARHLYADSGPTCGSKARRRRDPQLPSSSIRIPRVAFPFLFIIRRPEAGEREDAPQGRLAKGWGVRQAPSTTASLRIMLFMSGDSGDSARP